MTDLGLYVTAKEAFETWQADPENIKVIDIALLKSMYSLAMLRWQPIFLWPSLPTLGMPTKGIILW